MFAHVKWFVSEQAESLNYTNTTPGEFGLVLVFVAAALALLWWINGQINTSGISKKLDKVFKPARPYVGTVVRLSAGALLLLNAYHQYLLAPNISNQGSASESLVTGLFVVAGVLLILGLFTRLGALLMATGYVLSMLLVDAAGALEHLEYLGLAVYIFLQGGCRWSIDERIRKSPSSLSQYNQWALPALRVFTGAGLIVLAFSEKLLNMNVAYDFLSRYDWNLLSFMGVSDRHFIIIAGTVELIVGLSLIFNLATRLTTAALLGLMLTTAVLLGVDEIIGHLFAVALVFAVWVNDTKPKRQT